MKIRNQLLAAFFLLSVLPLSGIVLFTFVSSQTALRSAFEEEAADAAADMQARLEEVTDSFEDRFARLGETLASLLGSEEVAEVGLAMDAGFLRGLRDNAPFLKRLELFPADPVAPAAPAPPSGAGPAPAPKPPRTFSFELSEVVDSSGEPSPDADHSEIAASLRGLEGLGMLGQIVELSVATALEEAERQIATEALRDDAIRDENGEMTRALEELRRAREEMARARRDEDRRTLELKREEIATVRTAARDETTAAFDVPLTEAGRVVGRLRGELRAKTLLQRVLDRSGRDAAEMPFALDAEGRLFPGSEEDRELLASLPLDGETGVTTFEDEWVIARQRDASTGLVVGIVRPIGEALRNVRRTAVLNFVLGQSVVGLALIAILILSGRMTRQVRAIATGAERVAQGDLQTRVPVRSRNELGQLASAFNRMAEDLSRQQQKLVEEEMHRRETELRQEHLREEYERKSGELEEARRFQLSLLPAKLPALEGLDLAVHMKTAAEVGGDYYDFRPEDDALVIALGDATGHGARAGTMVTIVKSLVAAWPGGPLAEFLRRADDSIRSMDLGRMAMAFSLVRIEGRRLTIASAGMPPLHVHRVAAEEIEEIVIPGTPLGSLAFEYAEHRIDLSPGDTVLMMSDGFAEWTDPDGESLGYERTAQFFEDAARDGADPREILRALLDAGETWTRGEPIRDDVTFVVFRVS